MIEVAGGDLVPLFPATWPRFRVGEEVPRPMLGIPAAILCGQGRGHVALAWATLSAGVVTTTMPASKAAIAESATIIFARLSFLAVSKFLSVSSKHVGPDSKIIGVCTFPDLFGLLLPCC